MSEPTKTKVSFRNSLCGKWRVNSAIGRAPLSSTVAGLIDVTSKPDVPSTVTLTRSRCEVSMTRCSCGLIRIGGEAGGHELDEVAALMRTGCDGRNALLNAVLSKYPANPPT